MEQAGSIAKSFADAIEAETKNDPGKVFDLLAQATDEELMRVLGAQLPKAGASVADVAVSQLFAANTYAEVAGRAGLSGALQAYVPSTPRSAEVQAELKCRAPAFATLCR
ncbi:hypothetical protein [Arvimicrobium flavum]|uniref:hypothetical protein n=1 Tax=Arvimicrobium flavum TaxID=3393320 RepID=UPI00237A1212|nr:hypothetical protein [Mesorhizobium shangrilense]